MGDIAGETEWASDHIPECEDIRRQSYLERSPSSMDPFDIRFTHSAITSSFRSGVRIDDAIDVILGGELQAAAFPPIEVVH